MAPGGGMSSVFRGKEAFVQGKGVIRTMDRDINIKSDEVRKTASPGSGSIPTATLLREMPYGTGVRAFWRRTLRERKYLLICFILPALLMWLVYITMKVYPFGEESVLVLDLNGQYVYFFEALRDIIRGGGSLLYSFRRALGGEFMGIIGYYLASPFSIITAIFPDTMMTEALLVMFLLKTGLCGLTFGIYAEATRKVRNRPATVIFSTLYALCAYAVVMQNNTMWIDNLIWLPLILLGIEGLVKHGRFRLYVITLALAVMSNFYIGYMTCIFSLLYFFFCYYSLSEEERNPEGVRGFFWKRFIRFGFFSLLAVAICAAMVWSSYYSLTFGKTEFTHPSYAVKQKFDFLDLISKMYFGSYDTVRPEGWPFVYCGMLSFILLPLYFFAKKVTLREKISRLILCLVLVFSFNTSTIDMFWHGMQRPNWLNYRYSFMLVFLFLVMAYKAFDEIEDIGFRAVFASAGVITLILFILQREEYENLPDLGAVWASVGFIIAYVLLLRASTWNTAAIRRTAALVLCILVSFEAYTASLSNLVALDDDVVFSNRTGYRSFIDKYRPVMDWLHEYDDGFYRSEKTYHRKTNDNMALGMFGVSNSTSTLNSKIIDLLGNYGIASKSHWSKYLGATEVFDTLFGIKYVLSQSGNDTSPLYTQVGDINGVGVYKNPYAMSVVSGVNEALRDLDISTDERVSYSPFEVMNETVTAMLGEEEKIDLFRPIKCSITENDTGKSTTSGHTKWEKNSDESYVLFTFTATSDDDVLMFLPSDYTRECKLYVNSTAKDKYFSNETCRIVNIGSFEPGEEVSVKLVPEKDEIYIRNGVDYFYTLDSDLFVRTAPELNTSSFNIREYSEDMLSGTIHVLPGEELIYTSIPYDSGWRIEANGEDVETFEILGGLMAFRLDAGSYNLTMKYRPDSAVYGIMISAGAAAVFVAICVCDTVIGKKRRLRKSLGEYGRMLSDLPSDPDLAELELGVGATEAPDDGTRSPENAQPDDMAPGGDVVDSVPDIPDVPDLPETDIASDAGEQAASSDPGRTSDEKEGEAK